MLSVSRNKGKLTFFSVVWVFVALCSSACTPPWSNITDTVPTLINDTKPALVRTFDSAFHSLAPTILSKSEPDYLQNNISINAQELPLRMILERMLAQLPEGSRPTLVFSIDTPSLVPFSLSFRGSLKGALETLSQLVGYAYIAKKNTLHLQANITRVFELVALPGKSSFLIGNKPKSSNQGNPASEEAQDGAGSTVQNSGQYIYNSHNQNTNTELLEVLTTMMGDEGNVVINHDHTTVTASGPVAKVHTIGTYIKQWNDILSRQVRLDIKVLQVTLNRGREQSINWNLVRQTTNTTLEWVSNVALTTAGANTLPLLMLRKNNSRYSGSQGLIKALANQGSVSIETAPQAVLLNHQPAEIKMITQTSYLARTTPGVTSGNGNVEAGLEPGVVNHGVSFYLLPNIINNKVYLQLSASLSTLQPIQNISSGNQQIQIPALSENRFHLRHIVRNGDTLIIGGIREKRLTKEKNAPFGLSFLGNHSRRVQHAETVLLITPTIL